VRPNPPLIIPPKKIGPPNTLVSMTLDPVKMVGTLLVIVNELAVILLAIFTLLVPAVEEIKMAPGRVVPPTMPEKVMAPVEPEFRVRA
jgi:hypothetical protein